VRAHVLLEIEVSKLVTLLKLEKAGKLSIGVDLAAILGVLEVVVADVNIDLAGNLGAGHLSASGLLKEGSKLVADAGRLHEARRGAVASLALALGALLLGGLEVASPLLLKSAVLDLEGGNKSTKLLELCKELDRLLGDGGNLAINNIGGVTINRSDLGNDGCNLGNGGGLLLRGLGLLGLHGLLNNGSDRVNNGSRGSGFSGSCHYILLRRLLFK